MSLAVCESRMGGTLTLVSEIASGAPPKIDRLPSVFFPPRPAAAPARSPHHPPTNRRRQHPLPALSRIGSRGFVMYFEGTDWETTGREIPFPEFVEAGWDRTGETGGLGTYTY